MGHRHALWLVGPLLLALAARLLAAAQEPQPRGDPPPRDCRRRVQVGAPDAPVICLDAAPARRLLRAGLSRRCLREHPPASLRAGDRLVPEPHGGCRRLRMRPGPIAALELPVDVNQASPAELATLPCVGPRLARRIARHRRRRGPFRHPYELLDVHGVGPGLLARIRPRLLTGHTSAVGP